LGGRKGAILGAEVREDEEGKEPCIASRGWHPTYLQTYYIFKTHKCKGANLLQGVDTLSVASLTNSWSPD
jgi:hypothetical protein